MVSSNHLLFAAAVRRHHTINNHRCEVKKAVPKNELRSMGEGGGGGGGRGGGGSRGKRH